MHIVDSLIESFHDIFVYRVSGKGHTEIVVSSSHQLNDRFLAFVVDVIRAQVNVLELNILKENETLDFLAISIGIGSILNHIKERHWFFWLLGGFQLFVLLNHGITSLDFSLMSFDLILREGEAADLFENLCGMLGLKTALGKSEVFKVEIYIQHISDISDRSSCNGVIT